MIKAVCFFALLAVAFAQTPQTGPLSVTTLTPGVIASGTLAPTVSSATAYHVQLYSFWVPENVSSVNLTFTDTDTTACSYISVYLSTYGLPCSDDEYSSDYQCANAWDIGNGIYSYSDVYTPYDSNYLFQYDVNQYWYVAIGKYYSSDYTETCTYQLSLSYNSTCPTGSVGVADSSSSTVCEAYTVATAGTTYTVLNGNPAGTNDFTVYKINVPTATVGHIYVTVNSTSSDLDLYGRNYAGASTYTDYNCYEYSYTTVGAFYIYDMFCYTPRLGDFFVTIDTDDVNWNATVTFSMVTCAAGTAGANCSFPLFPFNTSLLVAPTSLTIPYTGGSSVEYGSVYFYWDIPANYSSGDLVLFANSVGSGYLQIRRNGFPTSDSSSGYEYYSEYDSYDATLALNQFDYQTAGRVYFMLNCYTSPSCNVTVSLNSTAPTTSAAVTTAAPGPQVTTATPVPTPTTGVRFTTGLTTAFATGMATTAAASESSSAIAVVPSIFALAAALFAML